MTSIIEGQHLDINQLRVPVGTNLGTVLASLPCIEGTLAYGTDTKKFYYSDGKNWYPLVYQEFKS